MEADATSAGTPERRAAALGLELGGLEETYRLPDPSEAKFVSHVVVGSTLHLSGTVPTREGGPYLTGVLGRDLDVAAGRAAARAACIESLRVLRYALGTLDRVRRIVQLTGFVSSAPGFVDQPRVINGATDLLVDVFGAYGLCARAAIGCQGLAMDSSVEVVLVAEFTGDDVRPGLRTPAAAAG